MKGKGFVSKS